MNPTSPSRDALHILCSLRLVGWSHGEGRSSDYADQPASRARWLFLRQHVFYVTLHFIWADLSIYLLQHYDVQGTGSPAGGSTELAAKLLVSRVAQYDVITLDPLETRGWKHWALKMTFKAMLAANFGNAVYQSRSTLSLPLDSLEYA